MPDSKAREPAAGARRRALPVIRVDVPVASVAGTTASADRSAVDTSSRPLQRGLAARAAPASVSSRTWSSRRSCTASRPPRRRRRTPARTRASPTTVMRKRTEPRAFIHICMHLGHLAHRLARGPGGSRRRAPSRCDRHVERARRSCGAGSRRTPRRRWGRRRYRRPTPRRAARLAPHRLGLARERLEQRELARRQLDRHCPARARARRRDRAAGRRPRARPAAGRRRVAAGAQPGHEHRERERLRQEVVGAGVERLGLVPLAVLGGEHEDRRPDALRAQRPADLVAVHARQQDVEDDRAVGALPGAPQAVEAVVHDLDVEALGRAGRGRPRRPGRPRPRPPARARAPVCATAPAVGPRP